jgi:hypothetical protein
VSVRASGRASRIVAVNDHGRRIGETHHNHNALISDAVVDRMRDRHELGGLGYKKIAREFNIALTTVKKICTYERRAQTAERWKTIKVYESKAARHARVKLLAGYRELAEGSLFNVEGVKVNPIDLPLHAFANYRASSWYRASGPLGKGDSAA